MKMFSGPDMTVENICVKAHAEAPLDVIPDNIKICPSETFSIQMKCLFSFKNSLTALSHFVYIHKCKAKKGLERLQFIKRGKKARFPECLIQSDPWYGGKSVLVPCPVDRTYLGHESRLTLRMRGGWCYLLPNLAFHAIDKSHRIWLSHKKIRMAGCLLNSASKLNQRGYVRLLV